MLKKRVLLELGNNLEKKCESFPIKASAQLHTAVPNLTAFAVLRPCFSDSCTCWSVIIDSVHVFTFCVFSLILFFSFSLVPFQVSTLWYFVSLGSLSENILFMYGIIFINFLIFLLLLQHKPTVTAALLTHREKCLLGLLLHRAVVRITVKL